jgi:hypothetical protein
VRTVVIEGRLVMRDRQLLTINEREVKRRAREFRRKIAQSLAADAPRE